MTRDQNKAKRLLYVLHMENPAGEVMHYAGSTTEARFRFRMTEHRKGRDTKRTRDAKEKGFLIFHVSKHPMVHPILEKALSHEWTAKEMCEWCTSTKLGKAR